MPRLIPSISECRQPYLLSNLLLVTESLTLIAGNSSEPDRAISDSRCTPVVVSSVTPTMESATAVHLPGVLASDSRSRSRTTFHSSASSSAADGTPPAFSYSAPLCTSRVASPPSSSSMFGPSPPGQVRAWWVHHQYSSRLSPFQAKTGTPFGSSGVPSGPTAIAAAAWSWVEKMLQLAQRTCAPSAVSVSMSTAVCTVMCSDPVIRAPRSGWASANSARTAIRPGISCSARPISLRPNSARERSATLYGSGALDMHSPRYLRHSRFVGPRRRAGPRYRPYGKSGGPRTPQGPFLTKNCKLQAMRISEAARRLGMSPRMLRYREDLGLLPPVREASRGHGRGPTGAGRGTGSSAKRI